VAKGFKDFERMRKDPDLESIREDPSFKSVSGSWKKSPRHGWSHPENAHEGWEECRARARLHHFPLRRGKAILEKIANRYGGSEEQ